MFKLLWILFFAQANKDVLLDKKVPDGDGRTQAGVEPPAQMVMIKRNPEGVTLHAVLAVCRPFGALFVALANGGCTPACNLTVLRTFRLFVCCMLGRVCNLQPGIFTTRRVVVVQ